MFKYRIASKLVVAFLPALLTLGLTSCSHGLGYYLDRGNKLFAEGKYADAVLNYRKAIQKDSQSAEAHYRLALADLAVGYPIDAYQELSHANELQPNRDDIKIELANVGLALYLPDKRRPQNLYDRLSGISQQLLEKNPNSYDGLRLKGHLNKSDGRLKEAEGLFRAANAVNPMEPNVILPLVETLFLENEFPEGEKLALELIQKHKDFGLIYDALYSHYLAQKRFAEGEAVLKAKVSNNPKDANAIFQLGFHYARLRNQPDMRSTVQRILDNPKDFPDAHFQVGEFYATLQIRDEALRQFRTGLESAPKDKRIAYLKKIASVFMAQGKRDEAIHGLDQALKEQPNEPDSRTMRALLLVDSGKPDQLDLAVQELQALVQQNGSDPVLRYSLGRGQMLKGDLDAARTQFQEAIRLRQNYLPPREGLANISERNHDYKETLRYTSEILAVDANNAQARLWRATALMGTGNNDQARSELTRLLRDFPQSADVQLQLGLLDLSENKFDEAEVLFRKWYRPGQKDSRALEGLVRSAMARNEHDKALGILTEEIRKTPDSTPVHYLLASTAASANKTDLAIQHYQWLTSQDPKNFDLQVRLGEALQSKGDVDNAILVFRRAGELRPKDPRIPSAIAFLQAGSGRPAEAKVNYKRALELDPDNTLVLNNLAFLLADSGGDLDEATKMAERAQRQQPQDPSLADTLGWVYVKKNLNDGAVQIFSNLVRRYPDTPGYRYHLGVALLQQGDKVKAKTELETALSQGPPKDIAEKIKQLIAKLG